MEIMLFKGTPEEFSKIYPHLSRENFGARASMQTPPDSFDNGESHEGPSSPAVGIDPDLIVRVLKRKRIKKGQTALYKAFGHLGEGWISATKLASTMGIRKESLAGVLGALGRRINETRGVTKASHQGITLFMEYTQEDGEYSYRLRPEVRAVLEQQGLF